MNDAQSSTCRDGAGVRAGGVQHRRGKYLVTQPWFHGYDGISAWALARPGRKILTTQGFDKDDEACALLEERLGFKQLNVMVREVLDGAVQMAEADIVTLGSPCQQISLAGWTAGDGRYPDVKHPINQLYYETVDAVVRTAKAAVHEWPTSVLRAEFVVLQERLRARYARYGWQVHEWTMHAAEHGAAQGKSRLYTCAFAPEVVAQATARFEQPAPSARRGALQDVLEDDDHLRAERPDLYIHERDGTLARLRVTRRTPPPVGTRASVSPVAKLVIDDRLESVWDPAWPGIPNKVNGPLPLILCKGGAVRRMLLSEFARAGGASYIMPAGLGGTTRPLEA